VSRSNSARARAIVWLVIGLAACGAPNPPATVPVIVPADGVIDAAVDARAPISHKITLGVLTTATRIAIEDEWVGMGCSYHFTATLERKADVFVGTATFTRSSTNADSTREVVLPLYEVDGLQTMLSSAVKGPAPAGRAMGWTDDYPKGSTTLSGPQGTVKIYFLDQRRQLLVDHDGRVQALDPSPADFDDSPLSKPFEQYRSFLDAVGLSALHDEQCPRRRH
jgi:hypothetical protein